MSEFACADDHVVTEHYLLLSFTLIPLNYFGVCIALAMYPNPVFWAETPFYHSRYILEC